MHKRIVAVLANGVVPCVQAKVEGNRGDRIGKASTWGNVPDLFLERNGNSVKAFEGEDEQREFAFMYHSSRRTNGKVTRGQAILLQQYKGDSAPAEKGTQQGDSKAGVCIWLARTTQHSYDPPR